MPDCGHYVGSSLALSIHSVANSHEPRPVKVFYTDKSRLLTFSDAVASACAQYHQKGS